MSAPAKQVFSLSEVAEALNKKPWHISYLHRSGQVEAPAFSIGGRRCYTPADVERVKEAFARRGDGRDAGMR